MSQDKKRDAIIEAALKRFAHFGVSKTTMSEIGSDLAISKASLYYYFPDKINLYAAVLQSIIEESQNKDEPIIDGEPDPFKAIQLFLDLRTDFIIKYYNILEFLKGKNEFPEELKPVFGNVREREIQLIQRIIEKGIKDGIFKKGNAADWATLLVDSLDGMRHVSLSRQAPTFFPEKEEFRKVMERGKELAHIFFKGLTC